MAETKIATRQLFVGYALAHNPGDVVPAENVKRNGWEDGVANAGTKAANEAKAPVAEPATTTAAPPSK